MADEKYFKRMIARSIGVKAGELTPEMVNDSIDKFEEGATSCASETASLIGICTPIAHSINLGIYRFMPHKEELELRNYIHNWRK